jgi:hypothetical protein
VQKTKENAFAVCWSAHYEIDRDTWRLPPYSVVPSAARSMHIHENRYGNRTARMFAGKHVTASSIGAIARPVACVLFCSRQRVRWNRLDENLVKCYLGILFMPAEPAAKVREFIIQIIQ